MSDEMEFQRLQGIITGQFRDVLTQVSAKMHARSTALELAYLNLAHLLHQKGILPLSDTIAGLDATTELLPDVTNRSDISAHMSRLKDMLQAQAQSEARPDDADEVARRRREMFRVIEGSGSLPPEER